MLNRGKGECENNYGASGQPQFALYRSKDHQKISLKSAFQELGAETVNSGHISTVMSNSEGDNSVLNTTPLIRNSMKRIEDDENSRDQSDHSEGSVIVCD